MAPIANLIPQSGLLVCFVLGGILFLVSSSRLLLIMTLFVIYLACALFLMQLNQGFAGLTMVVVGTLVSAAGYLTVQQAAWQRTLATGRSTLFLWSQQPSQFAPARLLQVMLTLLALLTALAFARQYPLLPLSYSGSFVTYWLILVGLFLVLLNEDPLRVGQGLVLGLLGVEVWFSISMTNSTLVSGMGLVQLFVMIAVGYLAIFHHPPAKDTT